MIDRIKETEKITERSKRSFEDYQYELGEIQMVSISWDKEYLEYTTIVQGEFESITLTGFSIGYKGEGPSGLMWLLDRCKIPYKKESITGKVDDKGRMEFKK